MQLHNPGQSVLLWFLSINTGLVEDIATGSAAGPMAVYMVQYSLAKLNE
jgi:predicted PhzF superfamily epimerase YddE/YHI9